jgi:predicted outer membrane repeat protein
MISAIRRAKFWNRQSRGRPHPMRRCRLDLDALEPRDVPATLHVTNGDDSGPGSLRAALDEMNNGPLMNQLVEIVIDEGVTDIQLESQLYAYNSAGVVIEGVSEGRVHIHPVAGSEGAFRFLTSGLGNSGVSTLLHLAVTDFGTNENGGALLNLGTLTVDDCWFQRNVAGGNGGAIASTGFNLTIEESLFGGAFQWDGNTAAGVGGAIWFAPAGVNNLTVTDSQFGSNIASLGGGIYTVTLGTTDIEITFFVYNTATTGAAIFHEGGILQIVGNPEFWHITFNYAASGGAAVYTVGAASIYIDCDIRYTQFEDTWDLYVAAPQSEETIYINCSRVGRCNLC